MYMNMNELMNELSMCDEWAMYVCACDVTMYVWWMSYVCVRMWRDYVCVNAVCAALHK